MKRLSGLSLTVTPIGRLMKKLTNVNESQLVHSKPLKIFAFLEKVLDKCEAADYDCRLLYGI
jgi:hypothetical protein